MTTLPHYTEIAARKSRGSKQKKVDIMDSRIYTIEESAIPEAGLHSHTRHGQNNLASKNASIHNPVSYTHLRANEPDT